MEIVVAERFVGPPNMGHGGYVAGLFGEHIAGALQVTLRKPTPIGKPLQLLAQPDGTMLLRDGEQVIAEAEPADLLAMGGIEVPAPPSLAEAAEAEQRSPAFRPPRGVHPVCFGCGQHAKDGLRIFAGPCAPHGTAIGGIAPALRGGAMSIGGIAPAPRGGATPMVAGRFDARPFAGDGGRLARKYAIAALDCAGAFAFIADNRRAGLLGRIAIETYREADATADCLVIGWQIGSEGRKLFAGTALFDAQGALCAAARATWFGSG